MPIPHDSENCDSRLFYLNAQQNIFILVGEGGKDSVWISDYHGLLDHGQLSLTPANNSVSTFKTILAAQTGA